jgi:hypothetical protein
VFDRAPTAIDGAASQINDFRWDECALLERAKRTVAAWDMIDRREQEYKHRQFGMNVPSIRNARELEEKTFNDRTSHNAFDLRANVNNTIPIVRRRTAPAWHKAAC